MARCAVVLPCHNEEATIAHTIRSFQDSLPGAEIWVCDNASSDKTAQAARAAGAYVISEPLRGKGNAVRRLFAEVDADVYIMADGDLTYDPRRAPSMVDALLKDRLDMITGCRLRSTGEQMFRKGHRFGNAVFTWLISTLFASQVADMLSGYRVMSRRFVKTFPSESAGFEIETELTMHALENRLPIRDVEAPYFPRPAGSQSKLRTYSDGAKIIWMIVKLLRDIRPLQFFSALAVLSLTSSIVLSISVFRYYLTTGLVPNIPTAILVVGLGLLSFVFFTTGFTLDSIRRFRRATFRRDYLTLSHVADKVSLREARAREGS